MILQLWHGIVVLRILHWVKCCVWIHLHVQNGPAISCSVMLACFLPTYGYLLGINVNSTWCIYHRQTSTLKRSISIKLILQRCTIDPFLRLANPSNRIDPFSMFFKWAIPGLFLFFSSFQYSWWQTNVQYKFLPMTGFELRTSSIRSNRSTNWATTTAPTLSML